MTEAPPIFVSKTFQGLPEDIRALEQAWVAIVEARRRRPTPALPPPNVSLPEPPVAPHVAPTLPAAPNPYGPPPMPTKR